MVSRLFESVLVLIRGGGDLATGAAYRLVKAGFPVVVTELAHPLAIRLPVSFASAVYDGQITVEGITARRVDGPEAVPGVLAAGEVPVLVDEQGHYLRALQPTVVLDARMAKRNLGTTRDDAPLVIGLGPGFTAGVDCHAVIETNRGHHLGRVLWLGSAEPNTGSPGAVKGRTSDRVLRAPAEGTVRPHAAIGDDVREGQLIATVGGVPLIAPFDGVLRGLIHPSVKVTPGMKIGDLDPRCQRDYCFTISDKSLAIGGGVVEAVLSAPAITARLAKTRR